MYIPRLPKLSVVLVRGHGEGLDSAWISLHGEEATHTNPSCLPAELALIYMFSPACSGGVSLMAMTWRGSAVLLSLGENMPRA